MKIFLKSDHNKMLFAIVSEKLEQYNLDFTFNGANEIIFKNDLDENIKAELKAILKVYGIHISIDEKLDLAEQIKIAIDQLLESEDLRKYNTSDYLADKLNYSYKYLSTVFTETTYASIESYIILRKVDIAKDLLLKSKYTLTEVAHKLNYSSVAHLSRQFKKTTGLTPSAFQRIINQRNEKS